MQALANPVDARKGMVIYVLSKDEVIQLLNPVKDPFLHKTLEETAGVKEVTIKEDKKHVSVKVAIGKTNTAEQMQLQQQIVGILKKNGATTVGLRFEKLPDEVIQKYQPAVEKEQEASLMGGNTNTKFIAVSSGKGGVGKSTVTVNLAIALMRLGKKVGIIDADIYGFSIPDMMGVETRPVVRNEKIYPVERMGVKVISMGFFVEDNSPIIWRGPMLGKMLNSFFKEVEWGELDYLLLDLPPGTGDIAMDVHELLPTCKEVIVTTPHPTAAFVAARAGQMAVKTNHEILGVVENMAYFESEKTGEKEYVFGRGGGKKLAEVLKTQVLGQLPLQQPYEEEDVFAPSVYQEDHPIGKEYHKIAAKVIAKIEG
ncbi:iron-sulfur cluster carrier protein [Lentibacillus populi]|uniref:Iron-sulfur cluster carrier protein n=2 Tax=Bacillales TaxID=1385 RepID=A0A9W5X886_9BACI|nr:iron-sulfur cluster carrier protein [Lentibacillus populi]